MNSKLNNNHICIAEIDLTSALKLDAATIDDTAAAAVPAVGQPTGSFTAGAERAVFLFTGLSGVRSKLNSKLCSSLGKIVVRREEETDIFSFSGSTF